MRTGWLRYPVIAVLVAAAGGLLVSCSAAHPRTSATQGRSAHPQTSPTAGSAAHHRSSAMPARAGHAGTRLARIYPLPCGACPAIVMPGPVGPNWAREIRKAGRTGQAVLVSGPPLCMIGHHPEAQDVTRSCPLVPVTGLP
jgi:hypothetical protein